MAKYALLDDLRKNTSCKNILIWQKRILGRINALNIGPMGLGGGTSALAVKIKTAPTHMAGLPVGVNISCWALRSSSFRFEP
jgi:fumarate hydratase subunit alpha